MSSEVTAAIIAAAVSFVTLIGTLAAQYFGRRATKRDTRDAFDEQRQQLDRTLGAQSDQLDRTLAEQRIRTLNERFATAAEELGSEKPAVRLAGVYAMAVLGDDWEENRQACVDVLCGYLRMPYEPDPGGGVPDAQQLAFRTSREVRHTIIRVITAHLHKDAAVSWQGLNFDFTGVEFDGGSFKDAQFSGGTVDFTHARFSSGEVRFTRAEFSGGTVYFTYARFCGSTVYFGGAQFRGGAVYFDAAQFSGGTIYFDVVQFAGGQVHFATAQFSGGTVDFTHARFLSGEVGFSRAQLSGATVDFSTAEFSGGNVDFGDVSDWSCPPTFPWTGSAPPGVQLPEASEA